MAVANMTARHFSPVLISAELKHVKDPEAEADLSGENWTIKVSNAIHEVSAAFTVDDESMEIAIKLPADYPLHSVEVKDIRRLGVDEKRWRGWMLAVQQVVTSQVRICEELAYVFSSNAPVPQNGRIVDGLGIFKRNVTNHFENQTECAICYSYVYRFPHRETFLSISTIELSAPPSYRSPKNDAELARIASTQDVYTRYV